MKPRLRALAVQIAVGALALLAAQALHHAGLLRAFDDHVEAWRSGLAPRAVSPKIVVAGLDARSIARVGQWPWPRELHARAIDNLVAADAEAILFDIDFSSPSDAASDAALAAAIARADGRVTLPVFRRLWAADGSAPAFVTISKPLPVLADNAWLAGVNVEVDADGILRTLPRTGDFGADRDVPSLAAALAEAAPGGPVRVDFSIDPKTIAALSYADVVHGEFDPAQVRGRRVVIGATATELRDDVSVPRHGSVPGVALHVLGAETMMQGRELRAPPIWRTAALLVAMLIAFSVAGHNAFNVYAFAAFVAGSLVILEGLAAFAFIDHAMSVRTGQFHVQALLAAAGVAATNLERVRHQLFFARRDAADGNTILGRVIDENPSGILIVTQDCEPVRMNASARNLLAHATGKDAAGKDGGDNAGDALRTLLDPQVREAMERTDRTTTGTLETDGEHGRVLEYVVAPTQLSARDERDPRLVFCITLNDVTEREHAHALARYEADHDGLTDLYSRYAALRRLRVLEDETAPEDEICTDGITAVIVLDLDRFGAVNEAHGFEGADRLLCAVADRLRGWGPERFIARLGSDEFLIVATCADRPALSAMLDEVATLMRQPIELAHGSVACSATCGVVLAEPRTHDLLKCAIAALREAKRTDAPFIVHDDALAEATRRHSLIDAALPVAIAAEEFTLVFQPQLDLRTDRIAGAEALVRWTHPRLGFVSPAEFIPIAEVTGQIVTLGRRVMEEACRSAAAWPDAMSVAVNVSARQMNDDLVPTVREALERSGLAPARLEIELTEGLMVDFAGIRPILAALRELGVGVAVDDFGTGYSSFAHLREAPFTKIKLDRAFVDGLGQDYRADMLFGSITTMVADLDMDVLIEGVETAEQLAIVRSTPCHAVQGYHVARPLGAAAFDSFVADWNGRGAGRLAG